MNYSVIQFINSYVCQFLNVLIDVRFSVIYEGHYYNWWRKMETLKHDRYLGLLFKNLL